MILIVDDDPAVTASLELLLRQAGLAAASASGAEEALARLAAGGVDLVVQDMNFSRQTTGEEGLALLRAIRASHPSLPVILMTAWGSIALAVEGMRLGASDFVTKPWTNAHLLASARTALALAAPQPSVSATRAEADARLGGAGSAIVGEDPRLLRVLDLAARAAPTDAGVLVTGESGTGKELLAEAIHRASRRRDAPFLKVNLGGISSTLFESEMFGHVRGAFTDARADRRGRFEAAQGGTILLDEIGDLEPASQVKLLRVLQDRTYEPLGSSQPRAVDVRVIAATHRDLAEEVRLGRFREDLLYRLNLIHLRLPPLRERAGDVPLIARAVLADVASRLGRPQASLTPRAMEWLQSRPWPGNVRQLRQALERAVLLLDAGEIDAPALASLEDAGSGGAASGRGATGTVAGPGGAPAAAGAAAGADAAADATLEEMERSLIERALQRHGGNLTRVAEALGLSRPALYRRMEKHGLARDRE